MHTQCIRPPEKSFGLFRRADELALAMECRCYRGGEGRTRMKQLKYCPRDFAALAIGFACLGLVIGLNLIFPSVY